MFASGPNICSGTAKVGGWIVDGSGEDQVSLGKKLGQFLPGRDWLMMAAARSPFLTWTCSLTFLRHMPEKSWCGSEKIHWWPGS